MSLIVRSSKRNPPKRRQRLRGGKKQNQLATRKFVTMALNKRIELLQQDVFGVFTIGTGSQPSALSNVLDGERANEVVTIKKLQQKFTISLNAATAANVLPSIRYIVFKWKPISVPTTGDILQSSAAANLMNSDYNFTNRQLYTILADRRFMLGRNSKEAVVSRWGKHLTQKMRFDDAGVPATATGIIYYLAVSDQTAVANQPTFSSYVRIEYEDA